MFFYSIDITETEIAVDLRKSEALDSRNTNIALEEATVIEITESGEILIRLMFSRSFLLQKNDFIAVFTLINYMLPGFTRYSLKSTNLL